MDCRAHDLYDFFNVTRRTVDVRKAGKMVMKSKLTPLSHYIIKYMLHRIIMLFVLQALLLLYFPKFEDTHVCLNRADPD